MVEVMKVDNGGSKSTKVTVLVGLIRIVEA